MNKRFYFILAIILLTNLNIFPQKNTFVAGGMGINYSNLSSLNDYLSYNWYFDNRKTDLKTIVDFYAISGFDISENLQLELDLNYLITSYSRNYPLGRYELNYQNILPKINLNYFFGTDYWKLLFGGGLGFNYAFVSEQKPYSNIKANYNSFGLGIYAKAEGDTYLSKRLFIALIIELFYNKMKDITTSIDINKNRILNLDSKGFAIKIGLKYYL